MAKNREQIRVAANGNFSVAPAGTTLPEDLEPLSDSYVNLGYIDKDGVTVTKGRTVEVVESWGALAPTRRFVTEQMFQFQANLQQWFADSYTTAMGGGAWTEPSAGLFRYDPPDPEDALPELVAVLDWQDGDLSYREVVPQMTIAEDIETQFQDNGAALLPITLDALADDNGKISWYLITNDDAHEAGS